MVHVLLLLLCAVVIYLACEWFVNAVEWLGRHLNVGAVAVGTILAAVGTALPESVVTLVAVTFGGGAHGADIGVGAAMGGPLVVGTIAYAVVGATVLLTARQHRRHRNRHAPPVTIPGRGDGPAADRTHEDGAAGPRGLAGIDTRRLAHDQIWFLGIFAVKVGLGLVAFTLKPWLGLGFFAVYALYFWRELRGDHAVSTGELAPLKLQPRRPVPSRAAVLVQTALTLVLIFGRRSCSSPSSNARGPRWVSRRWWWRCCSRRSRPSSPRSSTP